ncbi:MAG: hypothetical protein ACYCQJ_11300 [Nitrososphaerales archaeon]
MTLVILPQQKALQFFLLAFELPFGITNQIALPVLWHVAPIVSKSFFEIAGYGTIILAIAFLVLGVRQWMILSKWTKRYKLYKELQKRVDDRLDFEKDA